MCAGEQECYITGTLSPAMHTHLSYIQVNKRMCTLTYTAERNTESDMSVTSFMLSSSCELPLTVAGFKATVRVCYKRKARRRELCVCVCGRKCQRERLTIYFSVLLNLLLVTGGSTWASLRLTLSSSISLFSVKQTQPVNRNYEAWMLLKT